MCGVSNTFGVDHSGWASGNGSSCPSPKKCIGPKLARIAPAAIMATLPAGATQDQVPVMLQHLLAQRFGMTVHEEIKPRSGLALVVGKGGPKPSLRLYCHD